MIGREISTHMEQDKTLSNISKFSSKEFSDLLSAGPIQVQNFPYNHRKQTLETKNSGEVL